MDPVVRTLLRFIQFLTGTLLSHKHEPATKLVLVPRPPVGGKITLSQKKEGDPLMVSLRNDMKLPVSLAPADKFGNPAPVEGVTFESSDTSLATVNVSPDGLSAEVVPVGPVGTLQLKVTADPKIGPEVGVLTGLLDIEILAGEAVTLTINPGAPVPA